MEKTTIRWGIIGCGDVTEIKSGPALQQAQGSSLVAVMRRDAARAADYARRHNVPRWYADAGKLIDDPEVDAVYVATPPETHEHYALRVLACGKPCYVEKPMARNHAECLRMVEGFERQGVPLFVAYYRRALPRFLKVKELIDSGRLGVLSSISVRHSQPAPTDNPGDPWRLSAKGNGGGLFLDLASHTLDVLDFLLGPLEGVAGHAAHVAGPTPVEDTVAMVFRTQTGVPGSGYWNFAASMKEDIIEITGTLGRVSLSTFGKEPVKLATLSATAPATPTGTEMFDLPNPRHVQQPLIQSVVDSLLGKGTCPSTGRSAARTGLVMDAVLTGYYGGREDGFWNRQWPGQVRKTQS